MHLEDDHLLLDPPAQRFPLAGACVQFAPWCRRLGSRVGSAIVLENGSARLCIGSRGTRLDAHLEIGAPVRRIDAEIEGAEFYELARALREHLGRGAPFREADMLSGAPRSGTAGELEPQLFRNAFATAHRGTAISCTGFLGLLGVGSAIALSGPSGPVKEQPQVTHVVFNEAPPKFKEASPKFKEASPKFKEASPKFKEASPKFKEASPKETVCKLHDEMCCGGPGQPACRHCSRDDKPPCCNGPGEPRCCGYPGAPPCKDPANWWRWEPDVPGY